MSTTYSSTRGGQTGESFRTVVMQGLARDRGLFVPDAFPTVNKQELEAWRSLSYPDLAVEVIRKFVQNDQVPLANLKDIIHRSCRAFRSEDVTPVKKVGGLHILVSRGLVRVSYEQNVCVMLSISSVLNHRHPATTFSHRTTL